MNRTTFLVDGFNLYHSLEEASAKLGNVTTKWLDLRSFCSSFLSNISGNAQIEKIIYFSALARHREAYDADVCARHLEYVKCLRGMNVEVELGNFKKKAITCPKCRVSFNKHEEKETDVAIGVRMMELFMNDQCDSIALVTGDNDLAPAIRTANRCWPNKVIYCCFPYKRVGFELESLATRRRCFRIKPRRYLDHQLPDPFVLLDGTKVPRPPSW